MTKEKVIVNGLKLKNKAKVTITLLFDQMRVGEVSTTPMNSQPLKHYSTLAVTSFYLTTTQSHNLSEFFFSKVTGREIAPIINNLNKHNYGKENNQNRESRTNVRREND